MALTESPICNFGEKAPPFALSGVDGETWTREKALGTAGLLVMFICNHCPYVIAVRERLVSTARELIDAGIGVIAIMPNDADRYPEDGLDNMRRVAREYDFPFPYVIDRDQSVARAYGAVCTPDFFGYNADLELQYRGRLDAGRLDPVSPETRRDLYEAMLQVARTGEGPAEQVASAGCSIKWKS